MLKWKNSYQPNDPLYFEKTFKERSEKKLKFLAKQLGYELLPVEQNLIEEGHVS